MSGDVSAQKWRRCLPNDADNHEVAFSWYQLGYAAYDLTVMGRHNKPYDTGVAKAWV